MIINEIRQTSLNKIEVCLEGDLEIKSTLNVIADLRLFKGKDLSNIELDKLRIESEKSLALERAIHLLSYRLMSRKELYNKLISKGYTEETANYCIEKIQSMSLINDKYYAESLVKHYTNKGYGKGKILSEFYKRGIEKSIWDEVLNLVPESSNKIEKYISSHLINPNDPQEIRKVSNSLYRRGFSWDEIKKELSKFIDSYIPEED